MATITVQMFCAGFAQTCTANEIRVATSRAHCGIWNILESPLFSNLKELYKEDEEDLYMIISEIAENAGFLAIEGGFNKKLSTGGEKVLMFFYQFLFSRTVHEVDQIAKYLSEAPSKCLCLLNKIARYFIAILCLLTTSKRNDNSSNIAMDYLNNQQVDVYGSCTSQYMAVIEFSRLYIRRMLFLDKLDLDFDKDGILGDPVASADLVFNFLKGLHKITKEKNAGFQDFFSVIRDADKNGGVNIFNSVCGICEDVQFSKEINIVESLREAQTLNRTLMTDENKMILMTCKECLDGSRSSRQRRGFGSSNSQPYDGRRGDNRFEGNSRGFRGNFDNQGANDESSGFDDNNYSRRRSGGSGFSGNFGDNNQRFRSNDQRSFGRSSLFESQRGFSKNNFRNSFFWDSRSGNRRGNRMAAFTSSLN